jgi:glyoxylase-like metal-dependent hydrolase (beta-lactamase superfamily II)
VNDEALFTGDLLVLKRGNAQPSSRLISEDVAQSAASIARLGRDIPHATLLCTAHSGYTRNYPLAMSAWREGERA